MSIRPYQTEPDKLATIKLNYSKIVATAGPCGLWPGDLGPAAEPAYQENRNYWNLGCASQRNLAAMVANPADLVQPRGEDPISTNRRSVVLDKYRKGEADQHHLSQRRPRQVERYRQMMKTALQSPEIEHAGAEAPARDEHIAPAPRVSIQAFCESVETAAAIQAAGEDRRLAKAHLKIQMGGMAAASEAYRTAPTPNVIILEFESRPADILAGLDSLAEVCDAGTRVIVIGRHNDVVLYRELVRRGVSDYQIAPLGTLDVVRMICGLFSAPDAKPVGRILAVVGAKGGVGASTVSHNIAWAIARDLNLEFRRHRSRSRIRNRRPRFQPGSAARHRRRGVLSGTHRHRFRRPLAVEMLR